MLPGEHDNPDGRIAEDARIATEYAIDLGHSLLYCLLLLISFTKILWSRRDRRTSTSATGRFIARPSGLDCPGLCGGRYLGRHLAGRPLVRAVNERQSFEADFRFGLVHSRENSEAIALIRGERPERHHLTELFMGVAAGWRRQTMALVRITLFTSGYSVLSTAFPVLLAAPRYIAGSITLGVLMQTAQAFQQMEAALSWPLDNLSKVAEWRASLERVLSLHQSIRRIDELKSDEGRIVVAHGDRPVLAFEALTINDPDGAKVICDFSAEFVLGERTLISGDPGAAIKLFKVVADLWPWGSGRVRLPSDANIFFMPERPYFPTGPLRAALCYPSPAGTFEEVDIRAALQAAGLDRLGGRLDEAASWAKQLTIAEQQRLGFARLLLHQPNWVFIQEATDALDTDSEEAMMRLAIETLPGATFLTVGYHASLENFHQRKLVLLRSENGLVLIADRRRSPRIPVTKAPARYYGEMVNIARKGEDISGVP